MAIVGIVLFALLLLAVPIGIALSSAAAAYIMVDPLLEPTVIFRQFFSFIGRYSLTAIPLFIFAGFLMEKTGLDQAAVRLRRLAGRPPAGRLRRRHGARLRAVRRDLGLERGDGGGDERDRDSRR